MACDVSPVAMFILCDDQLHIFQRSNWYGWIRACERAQGSSAALQHHHRQVRALHTNWHFVRFFVISVCFPQVDGCNCLWLLAHRGRHNCVQASFHFFSDLKRKSTWKYSGTLLLSVWSPLTALSSTSGSSSGDMSFFDQLFGSSCWHLNQW